MRHLIIYYDGNRYRSKLVKDKPAVTEEFRGLGADFPGFSPEQFDLDEDCDITAVVELSDDAAPTVYDADGDDVTDSL